MSGDEEQTAILRAIWNEMKALNSRTDGVSQRLDGVSARLDKLVEETHAGLADVRQEMHDGFAGLDARIDATNERLDGTNERLDRFGQIAGDHVRDLRERVARLEALAGVTPAR